MPRDERCLQLTFFLGSATFLLQAGMDPIRVHVGGDEVLLDDSRRYVERAVTAGVEINDKSERAA